MSTDLSRKHLQTEIWVWVGFNLFVEGLLALDPLEAVQGVGLAAELPSVLPLRELADPVTEGCSRQRLLRAPLSCHARR